MREIESHEWHTIIHCLRVAAEQFDRDAETVEVTGNQQLVFTFKEQAFQARKLSFEIEEAR